MPSLRDSIEGVILGTAAGDAIGLPREGLSPRRAERLFGPAPLEHRLLFGHGMVSDDTEHTCMVAQSLLESGGDTQLFARRFAMRLRWWLAAIPAGIGFGTLRAILKLWLGIPPGRSGVRSAGNGPAMRAAICGVYARESEELRRALVTASTQITHTDPRAEQGAMVIAEAAAYGSRVGPAINPGKCLQLLLPLAADTDLIARLRSAIEQAARGSSPKDFALQMGFGSGVSGFVNHTVPAAIFCWLRFPTDFRAAVEAAVLLGGDTDTVAAITGALAGATLGSSAIPATWVNGLIDWPWSVPRMRRMAEQLTTLKTGKPQRTYAAFWPAVLLRNACFATVILGHALRRLLPPY